jgi:hypothetical protein
VYSGNQGDTLNVLLLKNKGNTMKKLLQILCSVFLVTTISAPVDVLANVGESMDEANEEQVGQSAQSDTYHLSLAMGDFGLLQTRTATAHQVDSPMIFISGPSGEIVRDAQVVTTMITADGCQVMRRALPFRGGYLIATGNLLPGSYLLEAEVVTNGWLLTHMFSFVQA